MQCRPNDILFIGNSHTNRIQSVFLQMAADAGYGDAAFRFAWAGGATLQQLIENNMALAAIREREWDSCVSGRGSVGQGTEKGCRAGSRALRGGWLASLNEGGLPCSVRLPQDAFQRPALTRRRAARHEDGGVARRYAMRSLTPWRTGRMSRLLTQWQITSSWRHIQTP